MNVVVTGGGTIAPIDDVRFIANVSSGRFSAAITEACLALGANVWHVHAPGAQLPLERLACFDLDSPQPEEEWERLTNLRREWFRVRDRLYRVPLRLGTVADYESTLHSVFREHSINVAFLAMAVSDFEPSPTAGKIETPAGALTIPCLPTPKVIRSVRDWTPEVYLVGFKLLSRVSPDELIQTARAANRTNRADLTVANDLQTLRDGRHTIHLVREGHAVETFGPGDDLARSLVEKTFSWASDRKRRTHSISTSRK